MNRATFHVRQPKGTNMCGQACVAMVLGTSLSNVCNMMGKRGKTSTDDLLKILRKGASTDSLGLQVLRDIRDLPPRCIARVTYRKGQSHWVLIEGILVYDPIEKEPQLLQDWMLSLRMKHSTTTRITSTLRLRLA